MPIAEHSELDTLVSTDTILAFLKSSVELKRPIAPMTWTDAAQKLNVLLGDESDRLYEMQRALADEKVRMLEAQEEKNVSEVKMRIEATTMWRDCKKQEAKIKRIEEAIRIAKIQARLRDSEARGYS